MGFLLDDQHVDDVDDLGLRATRRNLDFFQLSFDIALLERNFFFQLLDRPFRRS